MRFCQVLIGPTKCFFRPCLDVVRPLLPVKDSLELEIVYDQAHLISGGTKTGIAST